MSKLWDRVLSYLNGPEAGSPNEPVHHSVLVRDAEYGEAYRRWKRTSAPGRLLGWWAEQYAVHRAGGRTDEAVSFLDIPSSKGVVFHFHRTHYGSREIRYFFDLLRERVGGLHYRTQLADRRVFRRRDWEETQERYYLKPGRRARLPPVDERWDAGLDQKFGNITVELELRDDQAHNLRLRATPYQDALYREGLAFGELVHALTTQEAGTSE